MSDYPSDAAMDTWATKHAGDIGGLLRGVARECCDWARANPAPQEPTPIPPTSADPARWRRYASGLLCTVCKFHDPECKCGPEATPEEWENAPRIPHKTDPDYWPPTSADKPPLSLSEEMGAPWAKKTWRDDPTNPSPSPEEP